MKMTMSGWVAVGVLTALGTGCEGKDPFGVDNGRTVTEDSWTIAVHAGERFELFGVNGDIHATPTDGNVVEIAVRVSGTESDVSSIEIIQLDHAEGVTVCVVYPARPDRVNECRVGGGNQSVSNISLDAQVDFEIRIPRDVSLVARTVNGRVDAIDLHSDVKVSTVNGAIEVSTAGFASAATVNGGIEAHLGRADWDGRLGFSTVSGSIEISLPTEANTEVLVTTLTGSIHSDFPLEIESIGDVWSGRRAHGTLGQGGRNLRVSTLNGSVSLLRN